MSRESPSIARLRFVEFQQLAVGGIGLLGQGVETDANWSISEAEMAAISGFGKV